MHAKINKQTKQQHRRRGRKRLERGLQLPFRDVSLLDLWGVYGRPHLQGCLYYAWLELAPYKKKKKKKNLFPGGFCQNQLEAQCMTTGANNRLTKTFKQWHVHRGFKSSNISWRTLQKLYVCHRSVWLRKRLEKALSFHSGWSLGQWKQKVKAKAEQPACWMLMTHLNIHRDP